VKNGLQRTAEIAAVVGAVGSVALTLYAGRNNNLPLLMILMSGWVVAPFVGYALARRYAGRWAASTRAVLDGIIVLVAITSLVLFAWGAFRPPASKPAAVFVAVPIAAWLLMLIGVPLTALLSRRRPDSVQTP
jgi:ACR3 family arsenite efflux pump ArsB